MHRWLPAAAASARLVSEWPALWLPGALAWVVTVGWIPFLVAVARPPSVPELTFLGARIVTSGAWPWNAILIASVASGTVLAAFVVVASANAVLIGMVERRPASVAGARRLLAASLLAAAPAAVVLLALLIAAAAIAPAAFNAPEEGAGPVVRIVIRLAPLIGGLAIAVVVGAAFAAVAARTGGVRAGARRLVRLDGAGWTQVLLAAALHAAFLGLVALLLSVLWAPIGAQLGVVGGIDLATGLLLVGFVAIWLCLVLAGGALHAWSATTWSRLLAAARDRSIHMGPERGT
jgi:hypothetical protein